MYGIVYKVTNIVNNKIYIGITTNTIKQRWKQHVRKSYNSKEYHCKFHNAIRKYGKDKFIIEQIDIADTSDELKDKERFYINQYNTCNVGYNMTLGGDGAFGYKHTDYTKKLISEASKRKIISDTYRQHMREAQQKYAREHPNRKHTEETKRKMSITRTGHETSQSTRDKISKSNSGKIRTFEQNLDNKNRQLGKRWFHNDELKCNCIFFVNNFDFAFEHNFELGKCKSYSVIPQQEILKL